jgi:hypothetical protein
MGFWMHLSTSGALHDDDAAFSMLCMSDDAFPMSGMLPEKAPVVGSVCRLAHAQSFWSVTRREGLGDGQRLPELLRSWACPPLGLQVEY